MIQRLSDKTPFCKLCLKPNHTAWQCSSKPRATLQTNNGLKVSSSFGGKRKPMKAKGRITNKLLDTRKQWIKENPASHSGYYSCYICGKMIPANEMQLDHVKSRTRAPELRFVFSNLKPSCASCNASKGSKNLDQL